MPATSSKRPARARWLRGLRSTAHMLWHALRTERWRARSDAASWEETWRAWRVASEEQDVSGASLHAGLAPGDKAQLLSDNAASFTVRERLYREAQRTLDLSTYYLQADRIGYSTAEALIHAAERGVRVRLLVDGYMARKKEFELGGVDSLLGALVKGGVHVQKWGDPQRPFDSNHCKLLIVDGERCIIGGRNLAEHYAEPGWRDVELHLEGPSVVHASKLFAHLFSGASSAMGSGAFHLTVPAQLRENAFFIHLLACVRRARQSVDIENAYWVGHAPLVEALIDAQRRGVCVRLLTNSAESNDLPYMNYRLYRSLQPLVAEGAEVFVRRGAGETLHCKYTVVDGAFVSLGSTNLDFYSPRYCVEGNVHLVSMPLGASLRAWFDEGLLRARRLTSAEIDRVTRRAPLSRLIDTWLKDVQ